MSNFAVESSKGRAWYRWPRFPLVPEFCYRKADEYNRADWWFNWLALRVWTNIGVEFGIDVSIDDQDVSIKLNLPWSHVMLRVPLFPLRWHQKLWRKPKRDSLTSGPWVKGGR